MYYDFGESKHDCPHWALKEKEMTKANAAKLKDAAKLKEQMKDTDEKVKELKQIKAEKEPTHVAYNIKELNKALEVMGDRFAYNQMVDIQEYFAKQGKLITLDLKGE